MPILVVFFYLSEEVDMFALESSVYVYRKNRMVAPCYVPSSRIVTASPSSSDQNRHKALHFLPFNFTNLCMRLILEQCNAAKVCACLASFMLRDKQHHELGCWDPIQEVGRPAFSKRKSKSPPFFTLKNGFLSIRGSSSRSLIRCFFLFLFLSLLRWLW
jgi:hypothetical protein